MMTGSGSGPKKGAVRGKKKSAEEIAREAVQEKNREVYNEKFMYHPSNNPTTPFITSPATPITTPPAQSTQLETSSSPAVPTNPTLDTISFSRNFWVPLPNNRQLFRSPIEFEVFQSNFRHRKINDTYFFKIIDPIRMSTWEHLKLLEYMDFWQWRNLIEFTTKFGAPPVQVLYANMKATNEPFGVTTYWYGREIMIDEKLLSEVLQIEGNENRVYAKGTWPDENESLEDYRKWFNVNDPSKTFTASQLPALHRLLNLMIQHILLPTKGHKTNMERYHIYYLRNLLSKEKVFNIPFIILSHIRSVLKNPSMHLPYPHILIAILTRANLPIPNNPDSRYKVTVPVNMTTLLAKKGWIKRANTWEPNPKHSVNKWIKLPGAKVNQYTDPDLGNLMDEDDDFDENEPAASPPHNQEQPQTFSFSSMKHPFDGNYYNGPDYIPMPPLGAFHFPGQDPNQYLSQQMYHMSMFDMHKARGLEDRLEKYVVFNFQLQTNWMSTFKTWDTDAGPSGDQGGVN